MYKRRNNFRRKGNGNNRKRFNAKSFDPRKLIENSGKDNPKDESVDIKHKFSDFDIDEKLKSAIVDRDYITPTPIQDQTIPQILLGRDVVGIANTGTGKTGAFLIPLINKVYKNKNSRVLIVAPTRELAIQINKELQVFSKNHSLKSAICIGGVSINPQISALKRNPEFVIGTPGRLLDLVNQRKADFRQFDTVVLDEVDRMLDMGFIHDVKKLISYFPQKRQSLFFSATMDSKTEGIAAAFLRNPHIVSARTNETNSNVEQKVVKVLGKNKTDVLTEILDDKEVGKSLVFVRTKRTADNLSRVLYRIGFKAEVMHGNRSQSRRQKALKNFKTGSVNILIATDVASRGIDVDDISHVINFDLPESQEDYIHRIGRTGRANKKGIALSFVG